MLFAALEALLVERQFFLLGKVRQLFQELVGDDEFLIESLEILVGFGRFVFLFKLGAIVVDVVENESVKDALTHHSHVVARRVGGVNRHKNVGHNTAAAVHHAVVHLCEVFLACGQMD